jgi:hypothetical protein
MLPANGNLFAQTQKRSSANMNLDEAYFQGLQPKQGLWQIAVRLENR